MNKFDGNNPIHIACQENYKDLESLEPISYDNVVNLLADANNSYQIQYYSKNQPYFDGKEWKQKSYSLVSIRKINDPNDIGKEYLSMDQDVNDIYTNLVAALREKATPSFRIWRNWNLQGYLLCDVGESVLEFPREILRNLRDNASDAERPGDIACNVNGEVKYLPSKLTGYQKEMKLQNPKQE